MYEELVKALRRCATRYVLAYEERKDVMQKAADAIEELEDGLNGVSAANDRLSDWNEELKKELDSANEMNTALYGALPKWIPVTERLPERGFYLIFTSEREVHEAFFYNGWYDPVEAYEHYEATHWMNLPEPPEEET